MTRTLSFLLLASASLMGCGAPSSPGAETAATAPSRPGPSPADSATTAAIARDVVRQPIPMEGAPQMGASTPLVYLVIFSDFQCPYCARMLPIAEALLEAYPEDIQIQFRQFPLHFHPDALPAACASLEAYRQGGDELFWRMHDRLFENQRALRFADLIEHGRSLVPDLDAYRAALEEGRHEEAVEADMAMGARAGVRGTPATFINGRPIIGGQPLSAFDALVREELEIARELIAAGVPRGDIYESLMRSAGHATPMAL